MSWFELRHLIILNTETGAAVATVRVCGSPLNCVGYNPGRIITVKSCMNKIIQLRAFSELDIFD